MDPFWDLAFLAVSLVFVEWGHDESNFRVAGCLIADK